MTANTLESENGNPLNEPDIEVSVRDVFGLDIDMKVPAFSERSEHVPDLDADYLFDHDTTLAILAGFAFDRRVMVQGYHGTGKSTHIEQVAARLNWPCIRVNLDSHISRIDLVGKDAIVLRDGVQVTEFREGIIPWALQSPVALCFDEYDAGRPDVMFVIQRILEREGKLTLPVVLAYRRGTADERGFWERTLRDGDQQDGDMENAIAIMERHGCLDDTIGRARHYGAIACDALAIFPESDMRDVLISLVHFCVNRSY